MWNIVKIRQRIMSKHSAILFSCICCIVLVTVCFLTVGSRAEDSGSTAISHGFATNNIVPEEEGKKGTATNPMVILELVPDMKYSQLGYMIKGCEPVDIDKILKDVKNGVASADEAMHNIASCGGASYKNSTVEVKKFDLDPATDNSNEWTFVTNQTMTQKGYFLRVADGTGQVKQVVTELNPDGTIKEATYTSRDVDPAECNFIWVPDESTEVPETNHNTTQVGDRVYMTRTDYYYVRYDHKEISYTHKNAFLKVALNVPESKIPDYHVVVKTITPKELNENSQWAERADLVFVTNKSYNATLSALYKNNKYTKIPYTDSGASDVISNFKNSNDLSWDTVMKLFHKIVLDEDPAGIIIDQTVFTEMLNSRDVKQVYPSQINTKGNLISNSSLGCMGSNNNVFKLCLMLSTMNPKAFYNMYLYDYGTEGRSAAITKGNAADGRTTGIFNAQSGDAKTYWGVSTFAPPKLDGTASSSRDRESGEGYSLYETKISLQYNNGTVNSHVYMFQSDMSLLTDLVNESAIVSGPLNTELFTYVRDTLGKTNATSTSPAIAIQFLLGAFKDYTKMKDSINVLDLEPCTISSSISCPKEYLTEFALKTRIAPTYTGKVNIIHQSSSEFIGKLEDINSTYDLIYMGLYYGRFNSNSAGPVYNESSLNGKIYLHVGDKLTCRDENQHTVNWPTNMKNISRGPGNDITVAKKNALKDFLAAGLPIVADADLYSLNTTKIDVTSNIYKFVSESKNKSNLISTSNLSIASLMEAHFTNTGLIIHMEEGDYPKTYVGNTTSGTISNDAYVSRNLAYRFTLEDSQYTSGVTYTAKLYIDISRDGTYSSDEVVAVKSGLKANGTKYIISKTLSNNFVGAIPWKLVVSKDSNTAIRDTKEGFCAIKRTAAEKKTINVLQINERKKSGYESTLNLQQNVRDRGLFYKYTANLNDYNINFTTVTADDFESWYNSANRFDKSASEERKTAQDKLAKYNMLIFGFADGFSNISNQYGALDNVKYYIEQGKSVLFTHDFTSYFNQANSSEVNSPAKKGYNFNVSFRDVFGMDRFGIRTTDSALKAKKDKATKPDGDTYSEIHGFTYQALTKLGNSKVNQYPLYTGSKISTSTITTTRAALLNRGQITEYPYKIDEFLKIGDTHTQYYQLDLEDDDMIVWYTLAQDDNNENGYFSCSSQDASNNYYIYSKGNITYSGVGHSNITGAGNDMEVKLFVNTMIAAYANGNEPPTVEVVNPGVYSTAENDYSLYVSVDYAETTFKETRFEDVSFIPRNNSLVTEVIYVKPTTADDVVLDIYDENGSLISADSTGYARLSDGHIYHLKWPQSYLGNPDKKDITFSCYYVDEKDNKRYGSSMAHLLRRNLFDLE